MSILEPKIAFPLAGPIAFPFYYGPYEDGEGPVEDDTLIARDGNGEVFTLDLITAEADGTQYILNLSTADSAGNPYLIP